MRTILYSLNLQVSLNYSQNPMQFKGRSILFFRTDEFEFKIFGKDAKNHGPCISGCLQEYETAGVRSEEWFIVSLGNGLFEFYSV